MRREKLLVCLVLIPILLVCTLAPVSAREITVMVEGKKLALDTPPMIVEGRILVPFRELLESMGVAVAWEEASRTVLAETGNTSVRLPIGRPQAFVNGQGVKLDVPALIVNGRTLVPLRFLGEAFGREVAWNSDTRTASIITPQPSRREFTFQNIAIGDSQQWITRNLGEPARKDLSEYGFYWYIYNNDYQNYIQVGIQDGRVVALYTNAPNWETKKGVQIGTPRQRVRESYGQPLSYITKGNARYRVDSMKYYDLFQIEDYYARVFYDLIEGNTVTAVLLIDKEVEDASQNIYGPPSAELQASFERQTLDLVNAIRVRNGLEPLKWHDRVAAVAREHSRDMAERKFFDHVNPDGKDPSQRIENRGLRYRAVGENIAMGQTNAIMAHEGLLNSPGHRNNILRNYFTHLGVGVWLGGEYSTYYTHVFYTPR